MKKYIHTNKVLTKVMLTFLLMSLYWPSLAQSSSLNVLCSAALATCQWLEQTFSASYDIPTNIVRMSSGEALALIENESSNDESVVNFDVWWGGTGDTHLKAVANGHMQKFLPKQHDLVSWATYLSDISDGHTIGVYAGMLGIIANNKVLTAQNLDQPICWSDLGDPKYRGQLIIADPNTSGTAYTFLSTIDQIYGPNQGVQILAEIKENILKSPTSGSAALLPIANDEAGLSVAFIHDAPLLDDNTDISIIIPCEGTGYEIGAASILKNTTQLAAAKEFINFTLLANTQNTLSTLLSLQMYSNVNSLPSPVYQNHKDLNVINYNFRIYSLKNVRSKALSTWDTLGSVN